MSIDKYLNKRYHPRDYNCAHLACEVWQEETGIDISSYLQGFLTAKADRKIDRHSLLTFRRIEKPISPCLVMLNPIGHRKPHVGVYLRGRILHITADAGVLFQLVEEASLGFKTVRFYQC